MQVRRIRMALLFPLLAACSGAPHAPSGSQRHEPRIEAVERGLPEVRLEGRAEGGLTRREWMAALEIPGLAIAVIDDGTIAWVRGYGVLEAGTGVSVTADTQFQSASVSKPLTALALLHLVERGELALDVPVNDLLGDWTLTDEDGSADHGVSLRQLLSHTAGVTPGGFPGYAPDDALPTLRQILDGEPPAANPPARVVATPGTQVLYSGLGFEVVEQAMVEQLGRPFETILQDSLFEPLGMDHTAAAPGTGSVARGHDVDGAPIPGGWRRYPETAAAGLWSTPGDLAKMLLEVARALRGESSRILSQSMARAMLSEVGEGEGLSWVLAFGEDGSLREFSHSGGNAGYRAHVRMLPHAGKGLVLMSNSDNGQLLFAPLLHSVANAYRWPDQPARELPRSTAVRILAARGRIDVDVPDELLQRYVGVYQLEPGLAFDVRLVDGGLAIQLGDQPRLSVFPESRDTFYYREVAARIRFVLEGEGPATSLVLVQHGQELTAKRVEVP